MHYDLFSQTGSSWTGSSRSGSSRTGSSRTDPARIDPARTSPAHTDPFCATPSRTPPSRTSPSHTSPSRTGTSPDEGSGYGASRAIPEALLPIINRRDTWLGRDAWQSHGAANNDEHVHPHLATGFAALDARLCEGGWPLGTCIEVLTDASGMGAMGLFLPAMGSLTSQQRWQAFISPPYIPYAPLLAARDIDTRQVLLVHPRDREEQLWSTEQALRSGTCSAVFSWLGGGDFRYAELRRLQLAAARGDTLAVLFRPREAAQQHAPASLRLQMEAYREVRILKQRSGLQDINIYLPPEDDIPHQPQLWELPQDDATGESRVAS